MKQIDFFCDEKIRNSAEWPNTKLFFSNLFFELFLILVQFDTTSKQQQRRGKRTAFGLLNWPQKSWTAVTAIISIT
jgi:hypothetical protein